MHIPHLGKQMPQDIGFGMREFNEFKPSVPRDFQLKFVILLRDVERDP